MGWFGSWLRGRAQWTVIIVVGAALWSGGRVFWERWGLTGAALAIAALVVAGWVIGRFRPTAGCGAVPGEELHSEFGLPVGMTAGTERQPEAGWQYTGGATSDRPPHREPNEDWAGYTTRVTDWLGARRAYWHNHWTRTIAAKPTAQSGYVFRRHPQLRGITQTQLFEQCCDRIDWDLAFLTVERSRTDAEPPTEDDRQETIKIERFWRALIGARGIDADPEDLLRTLVQYELDQEFGNPPLPTGAFPGLMKRQPNGQLALDVAARDRYRGELQRQLRRP